MKKTVFILSGPAGVGKTTIWEALAKKDPQVEKIITSTTRSRREGEENGVHYYFLEKEDFLTGIERGDFIEYAYVHGENIYGSTYGELDRVLSHNKFPFYIIEPQGMRSLAPHLREKNYNVETIFMLPPSIEILEERLGKRGTETEKERNTRLETAKEELACKDLYDHCITNDTIEQTVEDLEKLIRKHAL